MDNLPIVYLIFIKEFSTCPIQYRSDCRKGQMLRSLNQRALSSLYFYAVPSIWPIRSVMIYFYNIIFNIYMVYSCDLKYFD